ncbi:tape measure chaperone [Stenotrophomonas phage Silvanus]|nr:tape measure chaperone [Stenotrophomonas phage Silvanus]
MLKKKTPETIDATLTLQAQGETFKLRLTYRNLKATEYDEIVKKAAEEAEGDSVKANAIVALALIKEWEAEYDLSLEGILEANDDRPYLTLALIGGFFDARATERVKN